MTSKPKGEITVPVWSDDDEVKALVDDGGRIPVSIEAITPPVNVQSFGWDLTAWRKSALLWGYTDRYLEAILETDASTGYNQLQTSAVPAGYIYVIQTMAARNVNNNPTNVFLMVSDGTTAVPVNVVLAPGANTWVFWAGAAVLKEGDKVRANFNGCVLNDNLELRVWGYKMAIAE